jgi:hypothetical protein
VRNPGSSLRVTSAPPAEDFSPDQGIHWKRTDSLNLNALTILDEQHGWAVGPNGTIARFVNHIQYEIRNRHPRNNQRPVASAIAD